MPQTTDIPSRPIATRRAAATTAEPTRVPATPALTQREQLLADAIAEHLADLLHHRPQVRLVDAATLATALGVSRDFVYAHASELGGERIGSGPRGRLRFDLDNALAAYTPNSASKPPQPPKPTPKRRRKPASGVTRLLPIRGTTPSFQVSQGRS